MKYLNKRNILISLLLMALAAVGMLFQNATVVDFTVAHRSNKKPSPLDRAIARADKDQVRGQQRLKVSDRQIHRRYLKRKRNPNVVGDIPLSEAEKENKNLKNNAR